MIDWLRSLLWKLWKWFIHLFTGNCEVYRLCLLDIPLHRKTLAVEQSLRNSRCKALNKVVTDRELSVEQSVEIILKEKLIRTSSRHAEFLQELGLVLERIRGVRLLLGQVEELRSCSFSQENQEHEDLLAELWSGLKPGEKLEKRITKQWQEIGFQGDNPATDFRGMGILSLHCLRFFVSGHGDQARSLLSHSHHPTYGYPYAVVGINLTSLTYSWLEDGQLNGHLYSTVSQWPPSTEEFYEIFCYLFFKFDKFWVSRKPENVMAFPTIRAEFVEDLEQQLKSTSLNMKLNN